jgi:hypothetical protein
MPHLLKIRKRHLVASGSQRKVYRHPQDPAKLVKVFRKRPQTNGRSRLATWAEKALPTLRTRWARKEYGEYLRLMLSHTSRSMHPPITHMFGFVTTEKGLGCLTEAVADEDGLGRTLSDFIKTDALTDADLALFNDAISRMYKYDIRAGDMTARNFVFGSRDSSGTMGPRECVLVDGFGDIHAIPVRSWGRWANGLGLDDSCKRLAARTGLQWDAKSRQFHRKSPD